MDVLTDEWVVHTPDEGAIKWWIGNAAEDGRAATVFARLKLPSQDGAQNLQPSPPPGPEKERERERRQSDRHA